MARILVIDDSASVLQLLEQSLTGAGHAVATATNGKLGLLQLRRERFDLLITDLYMPELDGIETLRRARHEGLITHAIAISSKDSLINLLPAARLLGAQLVLQKPFAAARLLEAVAEVLARPPLQPTVLPTQSSSTIPGHTPHAARPNPKPAT